MFLPESDCNNQFVRINYVYNTRVGAMRSLAPRVQTPFNNCDQEL